MATTEFGRALTDYLRRIRGAHARRASHDQRRGLFVEFIRGAFNVSVEDVELEEHVIAAGVRGYIDALYRDIIFEFKRDLARERSDGQDKLQTYLRSKLPERHFGVLTDGLVFEAYRLREGQLEHTETLDLPQADEETAFLWFDCFLFSSHDIPPTPEDVVRRFGPTSPVFLAAYDRLAELFGRGAELPAVQVKLSEWNRLLGKVYGTPVGDEDLFLRHTYLALLVRLLAYCALFHRTPSDQQLVGTVDGRAFERLVHNLAEEDFFAWVLVEALRGGTVDLLRGLTAHVRAYDLSQVGSQDLLQRLYQELVDPGDRHDLGEYYTPDWLAELTLREAHYDGSQSLLDPACGSGTFLFTAIRLAREAGLDGRRLIDWAQERIVGVDVHPVAVVISRVNYVLALDRHAGLGQHRRTVTVPVYMADSLITSKEDVERFIPVPADGGQFEIPEELAERPEALDAAVQEMMDFAGSKDLSADAKVKGFLACVEREGYPGRAARWGSNLRLLTKLMGEGRDTIWAFLLRNLYRPVYLSLERFDLVVGNPPWLSYRYVRAADYQKQVKALAKHYGLVGPREVRLFTHTELATVFFAHAVARYVKEGGALAFVMPRSVSTGAQQHRRFQERFAPYKILDLKDVAVPSERSAKVFGTDSCVLFWGRELGGPTPVTRLSGKLPRKNLTLAEARAHLSEERGFWVPPGAPRVPSPYFAEVRQGATMVPRAVWLVAPFPDAPHDERHPYLRSDPEVTKGAKPPWDDISMQGEVEPDFIYVTALSTHLVPFGMRHLNLVVLPLLPGKRGRPWRVGNSADLAVHGYIRVSNWMHQAAEYWEARKKRGTELTLEGRLNYHGLLTGQFPGKRYCVIYNTSGSHVAAAVADRRRARGSEFRHLRPGGFAAQHTTYAYQTSDEQEAHYLCAFLNAPLVGPAIEPYQPRGAYKGPRHVCRRPFEVVPLPRFDAQNRLHKRLASLSEKCHQKVDGMGLPLDAEIGRLRQRIRAELADELRRIDEVLAAILDEARDPASRGNPGPEPGCLPLTD